MSWNAGVWLEAYRGSFGAIEARRITSSSTAATFGESRRARRRSTGIRPAMAFALWSRIVALPPCCARSVSSTVPWKRTMTPTSSAQAADERAARNAIVSAGWSFIGPPQLRSPLLPEFLLLLFRDFEVVHVEGGLRSQLDKEGHRGDAVAFAKAPGRIPEHLLERHRKPAPGFACRLQDREGVGQALGRIHQADRESMAGGRDPVVEGEDELVRIAEGKRFPGAESHRKLVRVQAILVPLALRAGLDQPTLPRLGPSAVLEVEPEKRGRKDRRFLGGFPGDRL